MIWLSRQIERTMRCSDGYVHREILTLPTGPWDGPSMRAYQLDYGLIHFLAVEYRRLAEFQATSLQATPPPLL
jgi:hypothetical protein